MPATLTTQTLRAFAEKWNSEWAGGFFNQFRAVGDEIFQFKINTKEGKVALLVQLPSRVWESRRQWEIEAEQPPIVNKTKAFFENQKILSVEQHGSDRILVVGCKEVNLIFELFGQGNIIITDKQEKILAVQKAKEWKGRTLKTNEKYLFPLEQKNPKPAKEESMGDTRTLFEQMENEALQGGTHEATEQETKAQAQKKALEINLQRQLAQVETWNTEATEWQQRGDWVYAHFSETEELIHALQRAKKMKLSEEVVLKELKKKFPQVMKVDLEKMHVEIDSK